MSELVDHVMELLEPFGDVSARRMFGGHGFFHDRVMFALEADDVLYFKVDDETRPEFDKRELTPFEYARNGNSVTLSYRMAPEEAMNSSKKMCKWADAAYHAAMRSSTPAVSVDDADSATQGADKAIGDATAKTNGTVNPMLAAQASPAEVAAKLAQSRAKGASTLNDKNGSTVSAVKGMKVNGKGGPAASGRTPANGKPVAAAKSGAKPKRSSAPKTSGRRPRRTEEAGEGASRPVAANAANGSSKPVEINAASVEDDGSLQKTMSRRAAAILTRSMLGHAYH